MELFGRLDELEKKLINGGGDQAAIMRQIDVIRAALKNVLDSISNCEPSKELEDELSNRILCEHHTSDLKQFFQIDVNGHHIVYGSKGANLAGSSILSSIYGGFDNEIFVRLESAFRALEKENDILRQKYIRWQGDRPNIHGIEDRDRIIDTLEKKILELNSEINRLRSKESVSVNVSGDSEGYERKIQLLNNRIAELESQSRRQSTLPQQSSSNDANIKEYEIKIRTLNSRIQELESQNRTLKVDYDGKIREKDRVISDLEKKVVELQEKIKIGDSRITGVSQPQNTPSSSIQDRMSSSMASNSSSEGQPSSSSASRTYGNYQPSTSTSNYRQSGSSSGITYGTQGQGSGSGSGTGTGSSYAGSTTQYSSGNLSGSGARYGSSGTSGSSYGTSGTGYTQGTTYGTSSGAGSGAGGASYGTSGSSYATRYGATGNTGTSGTSGTSGASGSRYYSSTRQGDQK